MDAHVEAYWEYIEALEWASACQQQREAEGIWEDNGCQWPNAGE